jgi:hypothetical protein
MWCSDATAVIRSNDVGLSSKASASSSVFDVLDVTCVGVGLRGGDAGVICVDPHDHGDQLTKLSGQRAFAAPDVERAPAAGRDGVEDH